MFHSRDRTLPAPFSAASRASISSLTLSLPTLTTTEPDPEFVHLLLSSPEIACASPTNHGVHQLPRPRMLDFGEIWWNSAKRSRFWWGWFRRRFRQLCAPTVPSGHLLRPRDCGCMDGLFRLPFAVFLVFSFFYFFLLYNCKYFFPSFLMHVLWYLMVQW